MYTFESRARYSEMNHHLGSFRISSIINYFQDCSTFHSEDINRGIDYLQGSKRMWLMNGWQLQILKPVNLGDIITVGTWPHAFHGFYGYRNFIMKNNQNEVLSIANSIWVYLNTETGRPVRIPDHHLGYELEPAFPMEYADRKITIPGNLVDLSAYPVMKANIDTYNHVNNGQYIKMAEEFLPDDFVVQGMRVEYKKQAVYGDLIQPKIAVNQNIVTIVLADMLQSPYTIIEFSGRQLSFNESQERKL